MSHSKRIKLSSEAAENKDSPTSSSRSLNSERSVSINKTMSVAEFMRGLPVHDAKNFSQFNTEQGLRVSQKRPGVYLPTEDSPSEQVIVMDKRCVLLRYLTQQWDKKSLPKKREHMPDSGANAGSGLTPVSCKKRARLEPLDMNMN